MGSGGGVSLDPVSAAIGAVGDVASGFINRKSQEESDDRNWRHTVQMWNMNNDYNSPVNQMKRYEEAGLNPNLLFSQVSAGNATQPSVPQSGAARFNLDLSRYLRKQDKMTDEELTRQGLENEILKLRKESIAHDLAYARFHNMPTRTPWQAAFMLNAKDAVKEHFDDPNSVGNKVGNYVGEQAYDVTHPVSSGAVRAATDSLIDIFNPSYWTDRVIKSRR